MAGLVQFQPIEAKATRGPRAGLGEAVGAGFEVAKPEAGFAPDARLEGSIYRDATAALESLMPVFDAPGTEPDRAFSPELSSAIRTQGYRPDEATLQRVVGELEAAGREVPDALRPENLAARREEIVTGIQETRAREREILSRAGPATSALGQFIGGVGAEFTDPLNVATLPIGATARAGILATIVAEAAVNGTIELLQTPGRNDFLEAIGEEKTNPLVNAAIGATFGGLFGGGMKFGAKAAAPTLRAMARTGTAIYQAMSPAQRRALAGAASNSTVPEVRELGRAVLGDLDDLERATVETTPEAAREAAGRVMEAAQAAREGRAPDMQDRPIAATPRASIIDGAIEEVNPRDLLVQPDVFQFKRSEVVAEGGQTERLLKVTEWDPGKAGVAYVFEYADGTQAIADGHQRVGLATRIMDQTGQEIRMAARVFREVDGFTPEEVMVKAALKNVAEAGGSMSAAMARDAARILRMSPEEVANLPAGPGIARAQALAKLSDEAFDMFINEVVPQRFGEIVGRMVDDPKLHAPIMDVLRRTAPDTTAQAESIVSQAMQAPVAREVTADLFGEREVAESLYLERAKVLERATKIMRDDRSVFRSLDTNADRIEGTGSNRLDTATNKQIRQQVEQALAAVQKLAHRAGPISEALNDGAKSYRETGRLKDAAQTVAEAVRREVERNGLGGAGGGAGGRNAEPPRAGAKAPDPLEGFADPVNGEGARAQIEATRGALLEPRRPERLADLDPAEADALMDGLKEAQGFRDIDDLLARGAVNHEELTGEIARAAAATGVTARAAPLKGRKRLEVKVRKKYRGRVNRVTDVARGGVDARTPELADAFVAAMARRYRVLDEGWNVVDGGYFDRKLTVVFDDGQLGEVQIWVPGMFEVKEARGHKLYEIYRDEEQPEAARAKALADMEELYAEVMDKLPPQWRDVLGQGMDAPRLDTAAANTSSVTSGEPSSARTSRGEMGPQEPSVSSRSMEPGSGSTAGIERSTRKNRMGDTSSENVSGAGDGVNSGDVDFLETVPIGIEKNADGLDVAVVRSRADLAAELDADDEAVDLIDLCVKG